MSGELTGLAKPVDRLPEGDRLRLAERDAPGPGVGRCLADLDFEPRLFAERLDDLVKSGVLEVEADRGFLNQEVALDLVDQGPGPRTDLGILGFERGPQRG